MNIRRLGALASRTVRFTYTVSGSSPFPLDMLRFDGSYPLSQADVAEIAASICHDDPDKRRVINLVSTHDTNWLPTQARWRTFGWRVE